MIEFTRIEQTCFACPSQWNAWDAEGTYYYIRFRYGFLSVDKSTSREDWFRGDWNNTKVIFGEQISDDLDGVISEEKMLSIIGAKIV